MNFLKKHGFLICYLGLVGLIIAYWALGQPWGAPPDEADRFKIVEYIVNHHALPHGGDEEVMLYPWGFSYGFQPILPYIVSAGSVMLVSLFTKELYWLYMAARGVNVIYGILMAYIVYKLAQKLFEERSVQILFTSLVSFLPQAMFMHTFVSVDSMAMLSTAVIVYGWVIGRESGWDKKSILFLGVGAGLCAMSYYDAYAFLLCSIFIFVADFIRFGNEGDKKIRLDWKNMLRKGLPILGIAFLIAGWWFIRSYMIYDGDFLGLRTRDAYAEIYAIDKLKPSLAKTWHNSGLSILDMLRFSIYIPWICQSFIGFFEHMSLPIFTWMYPIYYVIFGGGVVFALVLFRTRLKVVPEKQAEDKATSEEIKKKEDRFFKIVWHLCMIACILITNFLCLWAAYDVDFQPQGRYIMPMLIPFMYYVTIGIRKLLSPLDKAGKEKARDLILYGIAVLYVIMMLYIFKTIIFTRYQHNLIVTLKELL